MIPKVIHYCWYGGKDLPKDYKEFVDEWKALHPDFEFQKWDETNSPMSLPYMQKAYEEGNFANLSNFTRLYALYHFGGIYLDVDVKLFRSLSSLLHHQCFLGLQSEKTDKVPSVNNAVIGAEKGNDFIEACMSELLEHFDGTEEADQSSPQLVTKLLTDRGLNGHLYQVVGGVAVYPREAFYPVSWKKSYQLSDIRNLHFENSYGVHVWGRSWYSINTLLYKIDTLTQALHKQDSYIKEMQELLMPSESVDPKPISTKKKSRDKWAPLCKDTSYIITAPYEKRKEALIAIESIISLFPSLHIVYSEQAGDECEEFPKSLQEKITYIGLPLGKKAGYNKLWGWNCGLQNSSRRFAILSDFELIPDESFLVQCLKSLVLENKNLVGCFDASSGSEYQIKALKQFESISEVVVEAQGGELFETPFFAAAQRDFWFQAQGFSEREFAPHLTQRLLAAFVEFSEFAPLPYKGVFLYNEADKDAYDIYFNRTELDKISSWFLKTEVNSFMGFYKRYNELFGWGVANRFEDSSIVYKVDEIKSILSRPLVYETPRKCKHLVLAITTYQRLEYLHDCIKSFLLSRNNAHQWSVVVADDGSSDGTLSYLLELQKLIPGFIAISNNRSGVAHQTNSIINALNDLRFDCCFKCDDDVLFIKPGWDDLYVYALEVTGQQHLCHYSDIWRPAGVSESEGSNGLLVEKSDLLGLQGAFYTLTPDIIEKVGFFDEISFGMRGWAHIDYSIRCWRAGLAGAKTVSDVRNSNDFIILNYEPFAYKSAVSIGTIYDLVDKDQAERKKAVIADDERVWLPYAPSNNIYDTKFLLELHQQGLAVLKETNQALQQELNALRTANKELESYRQLFFENEKLKLKIIQTQDQVFQAEASIKQHNDTINWKEKQLTDIKNELWAVRNELVSAKNELGSAKSELMASQKDRESEVERKDLIRNWYHKEYEVLPLWYKRFGHVIKIATGKRKLFSKN